MSATYLKDAGNGKKLLMVGEKPMLLIGGEVHNSCSSSESEMDRAWEKAKALGMNTLLVPVTWELLEPEEGKFDFTQTDMLVSNARKHGGKLGVLWFGAWKNAQCYYAPAWVKADSKRFPRAEVIKGRAFMRNQNFYGMPYSTLSYFGEETKKCDARAFAVLMEHIREIDGEENTIVTVQVENETGLQGAARENSDYADSVFAGQVPQAFADYMRANTETMVPDVKEAVEGGKPAGSWEEVFGACAEEIFSAYHVASYVEAVAKAGKAVYPLPMAANAWLDKGGKPGEYPSGGPVARMMEVWHFAAPSIDVLCPDIYVPDFVNVCNAYTRAGNQLYIPECATHSYEGPRLIDAVGHYHCLCYAPFGFEEMGEPFSATQGFLFGMDTSDPALQTPQSVSDYHAAASAIASMMPMLLERYGTKDLQGASGERADAGVMDFRSFRLTAVFNTPTNPGKNGAVLVMKESEDTFFILTQKGAILWESQIPGKPYVDVLELEDGCFADGVWKRNRRLNGDEVLSFNSAAPTLLRLKLLAYGDNEA